MGMVWWYYFIRFWIWVLVEIPWRVKFIHSNRRPKKTGYVAAFNHSHIMDPLHLISHEWRIVHYLAKKELFSTPIGNWFHSGMQEILVDRQAKGNDGAVEYAVEMLRKGHIVGIFPEGTTKKKGRRELLPAHKGVARLALKARVPIVPVGISGNLDPFRKRTKKWGNEQQVVVFGKPMYLDKYYGQEDDPEVLQKIADKVMMKIDKLIDEGDVVRTGKPALPHRSYLEVCKEEGDYGGVQYAPTSVSKGKAGKKGKGGKSKAGKKGKGGKSKAGKKGKGGKKGKRKKT